MKDMKRVQVWKASTGIRQAPTHVIHVVDRLLSLGGWMGNFHPVVAFAQRELHLAFFSFFHSDPWPWCMPRLSHSRAPFLTMASLRFILHMN